jgi:hypothetical protein
MTRFPAWIRVLSVFAVSLIAGEHALASLHQALTPHELCAEHGELVHADHALAGNEAAHGTTPAVDAAPQAEPEHHHCGVIPTAPARASVVAPGGECTVGAGALSSTTSPCERAVFSVDVLAFAPKASPPA